MDNEDLLGTQITFQIVGQDKAFGDLVWHPISNCTFIITVECSGTHEYTPDKDEFRLITSTGPNKNIQNKVWKYYQREWGANDDEYLNRPWPFRFPSFTPTVRGCDIKGILAYTKGSDDRMVPFVDKDAL